MSSVLTHSGLGRAETLVLPPPFTLVNLREAGDAFAHAQAIAADAGAGTLVWVRRFDLAEFAVVFEPEQPLAVARLVLYPAMAALADAIASHCPPEKVVSFRWPTTLLFDGARIGGGRLAWPEGTAEDAVPDWLVFGAMVMMDTLDPEAPGRTPEATSLIEEGFDVDAGSLIESASRHLMVHLDTWQQRGFQTMARSYLDRISRLSPDRHGLHPTGDLLIGPAASPERHPLLPALAAAEWYDPQTRGPRL